MNRDFGHLRSLLNGEVSKESWEDLADTLSDLRRGEARHVLELDWRPYIEAHLDRFPDDLRVAPLEWYDPIDLELLRFARDKRALFVRAHHAQKPEVEATWPRERGVNIPHELPAPHEITRIDLGGQTALSLHKPEGAGFFAAGCSDGRWGIWDEQTLQPIAQGDVDGVSSAKRIRQIAVSPDGSRLALSVQTSGQWIERDFILLNPSTGETLLEESYSFDRKFRWLPDSKHLVTHSTNHTFLVDRDGQKLCEHLWRNRGGMRYSLTDYQVYVLREENLWTSPVGSTHESSAMLHELYERVESYQWSEDGFACAPQHGLFSMSTTAVREDCFLLCALQAPSDVRMTFSLDDAWQQIVFQHVAWGERAARIALGLVHVGARRMTFCVYDATEHTFTCAHEADLSGYYSPDARSLFIRDDTALVVNDGHSLTILDL